MINQRLITDIGEEIISKLKELETEIDKLKGALKDGRYE